MFEPHERKHVRNLGFFEKKPDVITGSNLVMHNWMVGDPGGLAPVFSSILHPENGHVTAMSSLGLTATVVVGTTAAEVTITASMESRGNPSSA